MVVLALRHSRHPRLGASSSLYMLFKLCNTKKAKGRSLRRNDSKASQRLLYNESVPDQRPSHPGAFLKHAFFRHISPPINLTFIILLSNVQQPFQSPTPAHDADLRGNRGRKGQVLYITAQFGTFYVCIDVC